MTLIKKYQKFNNNQTLKNEMIDFGRAIYLFNLLSLFFSIS